MKLSNDAKLSVMGKEMTDDGRRGLLMLMGPTLIFSELGSMAVACGDVVAIAAVGQSVRVRGEPWGRGEYASVRGDRLDLVEVVLARMA